MKHKFIFLPMFHIFLSHTTFLFASNSSDKKQLYLYRVPIAYTIQCNNEGSQAQIHCIMCQSPELILCFDFQTHKVHTPPLLLPRAISQSHILCPKTENVISPTASPDLELTILLADLQQKIIEKGMSDTKKEGTVSLINQFLPTILPQDRPKHYYINLIRQALKDSNTNLETTIESWYQKGQQLSAKK